MCSISNCIQTQGCNSNLVCVYVIEFSVDIMHGSLIKNRSRTIFSLSQTTVLSVGKERGEESCWDGFCDLKYTENMCKPYTKPFPCIKFCLAQTTLLSVGKQKGAEASWLVVVTCNLYTICARVIYKTLLLHNFLPITKHTYIYLETERCRVKRVLGLIFET